MESRAFELSHAKGLSLPEARRFYEEKIAAADSGLVVMYACALGEVAGDDSQKGGYYSYSLRRAALEWADQYHTCADAPGPPYMRAACPLITSTPKLKNPELGVPCFPLLSPAENKIVYHSKRGDAEIRIPLFVPPVTFLRDRQI